MDKDIGTSVARNTSIMFGAQAVTWVSGFVLLLFLPRYLGSEDYGRLYLAISMVMILSIIIDFGGNYLIPKEVSRSKEKTSALLVSYIGIRTVIWAICMALLFLFSYLVEYSPVVITLIIILGISKFAEGVMKTIKGCFQGHERMEYPSLGVIAEQLFVSAAAVCALLLGAGPVTVAVIMAVGMFLNLVVCLRFLPIIVDRFPGFRISVPLKLIKESIPYFLWSVFAVIYYRIDAVMLSVFSTESVVGWYGGAYRFFDIVMFLPSIMTTVLFPVFSRLTTSGDNRMSHTFQQSLKYVIMAGIPICIFFFAFSENIIDLFYGAEEYGPSILILKIFSVGIIIVYIDFILGSIILATDKQEKWAAVGFVAILLNVGLNYVAIPYSETLWSNGGIGAALSTLVTEAFVMVAALTMLPRRYFEGYTVSVLARGGLSGLILGGFMWALHGSGIYWLVQIALGLILYLVTAVVLNIITHREISFFKEFLTERSFLSFLTTKREM